MWRRVDHPNVLEVEAWDYHGDQGTGAVDRELERVALTLSFLSGEIYSATMRPPSLLIVATLQTSSQPSLRRCFRTLCNWVVRNGMV